MEEEKSKYISLREATKYCSYSQEYLSLRARQGKLKAVKIGRNWVTKKEWIQEYIEKVKRYKNRPKEDNIKQIPPPPTLPIASLPPLLPLSFKRLISAFFFFLFCSSLISLIWYSFYQIEWTKIPFFFLEIVDRYFLALGKLQKNLEKFESNITFSLWQYSQENKNKIKETVTLWQESFKAFALNPENSKETLSSLGSIEVLDYTLGVFKEYFQFLKENYQRTLTSFHPSIFLANVHQFFQGLRKIPTLFPQTKEGIKGLLCH